MNDDLISRISLKQSIVASLILGGEKTLEQIIDEEPSIDAVQVVQCKDCLFNDGDGPNENDKYWCALHQSFMQYCSEAERKKETCNNKTGNLQ